MILMETEGYIWRGIGRGNSPCFSGCFAKDHVETSGSGKFITQIDWVVRLSTHARRRAEAY